jgi:hypothetical protein
MRSPSVPDTITRRGWTYVFPGELASAEEESVASDFLVVLDGLDMSECDVLYAAEQRQTIHGYGAVGGAGDEGVDC